MSSDGIGAGGPTRPWWMWIESPLQLLCAIEAHHHGLSGDAAVATLRTGQPGLTATLAETIGMGLPRGLTVAAPEPRPEPVGERWLLGDAFSGSIHQRLLLDELAGRLSRTSRLPRELVIVDDGLATIHLLDLLTSSHPVPLTRARVSSSTGHPRRLIGRQAWRLVRTIAEDGGITAFTGMPVAPELEQACDRVGIRVVHNDFSWLRSRPDRPAPPEDTVVLGTSLVVNGLIDGDRYFDWLSSLAEGGPVGYYPHRRESPGFLNRLHADPRFRVSRVAVAAELTLSGLQHRHTVWSLPSTALVTLSRIVGSRATLRSLTVPETWWTDKADPALRNHLISLSQVPGRPRIVETTGS